MTGFRSNKLRYDCKRDGCYHDTLPDWSDINDAFPGSIRPTDVDALVEINDEVLFIEQKGVGVSIPTGQRMAFQSLSRKDGVTVLAFRPGTEFEIEALFYVNGAGSGWQSMYRSDLLSWLSLWADNAKNKQRNVA